jgi:hypothetical protein
LQAAQYREQRTWPIKTTKPEPSRTTSLLNGAEAASAAACAIGFYLSLDKEFNYRKKNSIAGNLNLNMILYIWARQNH